MCSGPLGVRHCTTLVRGDLIYFRYQLRQICGTLSDPHIDLESSAIALRSRLIARMPRTLRIGRGAADPATYHRKWRVRYGDVLEGGRETDRKETVRRT